MLGIIRKYRDWLEIDPHEAIASVVVAIVFIVAAISGISSARANAAVHACDLDPTSFVRTVNQWRAQKGVQPLQFSQQLQVAANDHIMDMVQYQYYGHTNPHTKLGSEFFIRQDDPAAQDSAEVLDGPNKASDSITNFKNSPEHYAALMSDKYHFIGVKSLDTDENWAIYDTNGNLQAKAGVYHSKCTVVAELADKVAPVK